MGKGCTLHSPTPCSGNVTPPLTSDCLAHFSRGIPTVAPSVQRSLKLPNSWLLSKLWKCAPSSYNINICLSVPFFLPWAHIFTEESQVYKHTNMGERKYRLLKKGSKSNVKSRLCPYYLGEKTNSCLFITTWEQKHQLFRFALEMRYKVGQVISTVFGREKYVKMSVIIIVNSSNKEDHVTSVLVGEKQNAKGIQGKKKSNFD